ncbi:MAG: aromatic-ring-hydroxylating dioxygenase, ferredoxin subunit [Herminiimonas sp.]|nr:aromatic-ring-hydroxylating dioxygenase, ferredoxin subunit [Herminiimonas sp.]
MSTDRKLLRLCSVSDVSANRPMRCEAEKSVYAVFRLGAEYFVISDACTHGPGSLSEGYVEGSEVECPFHSGRFDIRTGFATEPPCTEPVNTWKVHIVDEQIFIDPAETSAAGCAR